MESRSNIRWKDLLYTLTRNGKIEKAAIIDSEKNSVVASSFDFKVADSEINTISCALSGKYSSLMKMKLWQSFFTCFRHGDDTNTIVGKADDEVLVAHKCGDILVIGISHAETPGSSIYEVTKFGNRIKRRRQRSI